MHIIFVILLQIYTTDIMYEPVDTYPLKALNHTFYSSSSEFVCPCICFSF